MKQIKAIIHIIVLIIGFGLVIVGQSGVLLAPFGVEQNSVWNLLLEFAGLALLLVELYLYNRKYKKNDVKPQKKTKKIKKAEKMAQN